MSGESEQPGTKVRQHIITATVDGKPRHRILGLQLRYGQSLGPLDPEVRKKVERIAARHGLDITRMKDWWWYADAPEGEPVPDHRLKRGDVEIIEGDRGGAEFRSLQDPLEFYARKGLITWQQKRAGDKLYHLFRHGNMLSTYRVMRFSDARGGQADPHAKAMLSPEYRKAMESIQEAKAQKLVFAVCCVGELAGKGNTGTLARGLDALAAHFRIDQDRRGDGH